MSSTWPKIIRDPVHNIIPFEDNECDRLLLALINTKEFQRLRRIKQLGMSQYVFPGADHSRFAHSIGVMQNARRFLVRLERLSPAEVNEDRRLVVTVAALLHDIGHGPFSHTFENIAGENHEKRTLEIIKDEATEVNEVLKRTSSDLPDRLAVFFDENTDDSDLEQADVPAFLTQVVSSQLDADRFDYLVRDSLSTGTDYGEFDHDWMVQHLLMDESKGRFYLSHKALSAAESYVFARYHMYRTVYFHKTTRAAEVMLRLLFNRYKELGEKVTNDIERKKIAPDCPSCVFLAFRQQMTLAQYLELDDHAITEFLRSCIRSTDLVLKELATGLLFRKLWKAQDVTDSDTVGIGKLVSDVMTKIKELGLNPDYSWADDSPSDTPYKPYDPDDTQPATQIYVDTQSEGPKELSTVSDGVAALKKKYTLVRYYFPDQIRTHVKEIANNHL